MSSEAASLADATVPDPETRLGGEPVGDEEVQPSLFMHIVKSLRPGQDLTRVLIPVFFLEPRSLLERCADLNMHPDMLLQVPKGSNPVQRIVALTRWYLTGWHYKTKGIKKPFNPVIGETFACMWKHDDSDTQYYAEQVSHHPPVTGLYVENRKHGIMINGQIWTKSKFMGNSSSVSFVGGISLHLLHHGERYDITLPSLYANGLFIGRLRMEIGDKCKIQLADSTLHVEISFKQKPMFGGDYHKVEATVKDGDRSLYKIEGKWNERFFITDLATKEKSLFVDIEGSPVAPKWCLPEERMGKFESRRLWYEAACAIRKEGKSDWDTVQSYKTALEEAQRRLPCHAHPKEHPWTTKKFHLRSMPFMGEMQERWVFDDMKLEPYVEGEPRREFITMSATLEDPREVTGKEKLQIRPGIATLAAKSEWVNPSPVPAPRDVEEEAKH